MEVVGKEIDLRYKTLGFKLGLDHAFISASEENGFLRPVAATEFEAIIEREIALETDEKILSEEEEEQPQEE